MSLTKGFLQSKLTRPIPKHKYLVGIILGLLMAISLYSLQYMSRESIRLFSISEDDLWLLTDSEVQFYNLIFAFIAVIIGQSFCFEYWFNKPLNSFQGRSGRLQSIVNDQRFLNWYFLAWFSKVASMYGFLFCMAGFGWFHMTSLFPEYNYMFVLMVIVLFFQTWNSLLLTFKRRAFKWMLVSALSITSLSYGLSKFQVVDYNSLNENVIGKSLDVKYHLRLPSSSVYKDKHRGAYRRLPDISFVMSKNDINQPLVFIRHRKIKKEELAKEVMQMRVKFAYELQNYMPLFLQIDKEVPMSFVHEIKRELVFTDMQTLNYVVIPEDAIYNKRFYRGWNRTFLPQMNTDYFAPDYQYYIKRSSEVSNKIEISISKQGYELNNTDVEIRNLTNVIQNQLKKDLDYAIILNFKEDINFETYFGVINGINEAIFSLRNEATRELYSLDFKNIENSYQWERRDEFKEYWRSITSKYPLRYVEIWDESGIRLSKKSQPDFALPKLK